MQSRSEYKTASAGRTHELVHEKTEKVLFLLGLRCEKHGEESERLRPNVDERIKRKCLQDLEDGEEVFFEPIFEIPDKEVSIRYV